MPIRFRDEEKTLTMGVGDLIAAGPRTGHLRLEFAGSGASRMAAGREVHEIYQYARAREDETFLAEVSLKVSRSHRGWDCVVRGRLDGLALEDDRPVVEEIKSTGLDAGALYETTLEDWPGYRAQVEVYLWMLARSGHEAPVGRLVLISLIDGSRHVLHVPTDIEATEAWIDTRLQGLVITREALLEWLAWRREAKVPFAHDGYRPGQAAIIKDVSEALDQGRQLLLGAPTGTGKTAAALHAALTHAYARNRRVFFATAKGTQQLMVERTLRQIAARGLPLRAITIRAREKACLNEVVDCRPESCPYATDYHDKISGGEVVDRVLEVGVAGADAVRVFAETDTVCPFELALQVSERCDVVVGDYNYVFAPDAWLRRLFGERPDDWIVIVDEAHNLVDRARGYHSPELSAARARAAAAFLQERDFWKFAAFIALCEDAAEAVEEAALLIEEDALRRGPEVVIELSKDRFMDLRERVEELSIDHLRLRGTDWQEDPYLDLAREILRFTQVLAEAGEETAQIYRQTPAEGPKVRLACLDPSRWIGARFQSFGAALLMSATLRPTAFHRDLLGLSHGRVVEAEHPSPFPPENRGVLVAPEVSTAYKRRRADRARTAALIQDLIAASPGNVAVYYPSFKMLEDLQPLTHLPGTQPILQLPGMDELERIALIQDLVEGQDVVLHAVLGGVFAEGVDLPPGALATVIVVGPALPQVELTRDLFQQYCEAKYEAGFKYAFLVPGLSRVVQAAGRVVRRPEDVGLVVLIGQRFSYRGYQDLMPGDWDVMIPGDSAVEAEAFWERAERARASGEADDFEPASADD